jgi:hypothetical protein
LRSRHAMAQKTEEKTARLTLLLDPRKTRGRRAG